MQLLNRSPIFLRALEMTSLSCKLCKPGVGIKHETKPTKEKGKWRGEKQIQQNENCFKKC